MLRLVFYKMKFSHHRITVTVILALAIKCKGFLSTSCYSNSSPSTDVMAAVNQESKACPPWTYRKHRNASCICGSSNLGTVQCKDENSPLHLLTCHCMSRCESGAEKNKIIVGNCPYLCTNSIYTVIEKDFDFQKCDLCNMIVPQNRMGQLCGKCVEGYAPSVYSYSFTCTDCTDHEYNWVKYFAIAYIPITLLYLVIVLFRLSAMSPAMNANILISQIFSCPAVMSLLSIAGQISVKNSVDECSVRYLEHVMSIIYGVWNLDFFHTAFEPLCLHPGMTILHVISLDYCVALYPIILILLTYLLVKVHDRFVLIQRLWKPATWLLFCFCDEGKKSNFLIETFGTFFLLSYVKVINTSFALLMPVWVQNVTGDVAGTYLYYNGSMEYFGREHDPYAFLAIFMFTVFNLLPFLLLCLYPCRWFQSCLNCCQLNSQVLTTFMDAFQGCYKLEPYDCRYWAAFYLFLRIAFLIIFACTQSGFFVVIAGMLMIIVACLTAIVRPYKQNIYNIVDIVFFLIFAQVSFSMVLVFLSGFDQSYLNFATVILAINVLLPPLYVVGRLLSKTIRKFVGYWKLLKNNRERSFNVGDAVSENSQLLNQQRMKQYN